MSGTQFRNVAMLGATGNLGSAIVRHLVKAGFNVTAIQRNESKKQVAKGVPVINADLTNKSELVTAFEGQDVVVSAVPNPTLEGEKTVIGAAIEAGVKRFVLSEYSSNLEAKVKETKLPMVVEKLKIREYVEEATPGKIEWSSINNGPFFDLGIKMAFLGPNPKTKVATFHDGGNKKINTTSRDDIGKAVTLMLQHPKETANKPVYVYSAYLSERQTLDIVSRLTGITDWKIEDNDVEEGVKDYYETVKRGEDVSRKFFNLYFMFMYGEGYGCDYMDMAMNKTIGLKPMTEDEIEQSIKRWLKEAGFGEYLL